MEITIRTKYNIGDKVWTLYNNKPCEVEIVAVNISFIGLDEQFKKTYITGEPFICYNVEPLLWRARRIPEKFLFKTEKDVINANLKKGAVEHAVFCNG